MTIPPKIDNSDETRRPRADEGKVCTLYARLEYASSLSHFQPPRPGAKHVFLVCRALELYNYSTRLVNFSTRKTADARIAHNEIVCDNVG